MRHFCLFVLMALFYNLAIAQTERTVADSFRQKTDTGIINNNTSVIIGDISITGNKKTKDYIILREVTFKKGDNLTLPELSAKLQASRQLVYNTSLFVDDSVYVRERKGDIVFIQITVKERWYFFPLPYFRLVDRNFNQWWVDEKRSLDRVNYGIKFMETNLTGQNDKLNVWLISGYNQQVTLRYELPYADKALTKGFNVGFIFSRQHEMNYTTSLQNKQQFFKQDDFVRKYMRFDFTYSYRPDQKFRHFFRVSYNNEEVADTILKLNPLYYPEHRTSIQYIDFAYYFQYFNADYFAYPTKGFILDAALYKRGLDRTTNLWQIGVHSVYAMHLIPKTFLHLEGAALVKFPYDNYFYKQALFGYGDFQMRGLEYYVADGVAGIMGKITLNREIFKFVFRNPIHSKTHDKIPFRFLLNAYSDFGYSYNPYVSNNLLNNTLLHTWGLGLDIVSIYDFVFKFQFSFNQLGDKGLYLHTRNDF